MEKSNFTRLLKMKKIMSCSAVLLASLGAVGILSNSIIPQSTTTVAASTVTSGTWGGATWTINGGTLTLSGGDIGTPSGAGLTTQGLAGTLSLAGVDPSTITSINIANNMSANNVGWAFAYFSNLKSITGLGNLSYSGSAYCMFESDSALTSLDISNFNTKNITNMGFMFVFDSSLTNLDVSNFDTSKVSNMYGMFDGMSHLTSLDVSSFNTNNVTDMTYMFVSDPSLTSLNLSNFDTSKVSGMAGMFDGDSALTNLNISNFDTSKVSDMSYMFFGDSSLPNVDVSHFDTSNVSDMKGMFAGDSALTALDLSSFTIQNNQNQTNMLGGLTNMSQLTLGKDVNSLNNDVNLPDVPNTGYTGNWQDIGENGTATQPTGNIVWTSSELTNQFNGGTYGQRTFVWQPKAVNVVPSDVTISSIGNQQTYATAWPYASYAFSSYGLSPTTPLNAYQYNVVINSNYTYYSDLVQGASLASLAVDLPNTDATTVYNRATETMTDSTGATATYDNISFGDGNWYWVDARALNTGAANTGSVVTQSSQYTSGNISFPIYYVVNSFNASGQIVWNLNGSKYGDEMRAAADAWNQVLGRTVFVEDTGQYTDAQVTLKLKDSAMGATNPSIAAYELGGDLEINTDETNTQSSNDIKLIIEHELGHSMGLDHTFNYFGTNFTSDIMTGHQTGVEQAPTANEIQTVKMIIANHDFAVPNPMTNPYM
ncbi:BspA family leucine-rich repeat surface protein [Lactococcus nasutitermitis]|uniref:BspA family leucine-rich repeat surface protein n=1 Tax=Lactococcus nasutitermitis TaxID=1652957 RepID=A0ABV9JD96_9LACT|nr:BspA family leucine-rich repeat surface protein [Lactococcus nasutitermitis]